MTTIDFQGLIALSKPLQEQIRRYLQDKETKVSHSILNAIHLLPDSDEGHVKLTDAIEIFSKTIHKVGAEANNWESAAKQINQSLWEYVEALESCASELFLQLKQVGFEKWKIDLIKSVDNIKELLMHQMDDLVWKIKRIEELLWEYRKICQKKAGEYGVWTKISQINKSVLDRSLVSYLRNSITYLKTRYNGFHRRFNEFVKLNTKVQESLLKFNAYQGYKKLEPETQHGLLYLYELLKIWEANAKVKALPAREPIRALRSSYSSDRVKSIFNEYYTLLRSNLFEQSKEFKHANPGFYEDEAGRRVVGEKLQGFRSEIHTLGATAARYREFILRTHPNPYVRSRLGFAEWIVGPEPEEAKEVLQFMYKVEYLDVLYKGMMEALKKGPAAYNNQLLEKQYLEVQHTLHELGQPLTSKNMMKIRSDKMLQILLQMDELGSFNQHVINDVGKIFSKTLQADWQYNVLFDSSLFHQLFEIHQVLSGETEDRQHLVRMRELQIIINKFQDWLKSKAPMRRFKEIESDVHDIKGYLQDFLAFCQRSSTEIQDPAKASQLVNEMSKQLLLYHYQFGNFFHQLHQYEPESKLIRSQFLFVDQYFDAAENKIQEIRTSWDIKD